jgi:hypothetical protein
MKLSFLIRREFYRPPLLASMLLLIAGCGKGDDSKITVYRIPKETQPAASPQEMAMTSAAPNAASNTAPAELHWTAPSGWEEQPATGFRKGSFLVRGSDGKTADVSVISFPEAAGGVLANVNRWRNQLKLSPISNESEAGTPMSVAGRDLFFVDLVSQQPLASDGSKTRILGGIFPLPGMTWFFKMMGPDQLVESQRDAFKQFLQSVNVTGGAVASTAVASPMGGNTGTSTNAPTPSMIAAPASAPVQYTAPPNWQEKPLSPMRVASFNAAAPDGKQVDVSVVSLAGMAGGDLANVNRWRGQVKLGPIDEGALQQSAEHVKANGHDFLVVDIVSDAPIGAQNEKQRIIAAILDEQDRSWFIKMMGEDKAVASQKDEFENFLRSLKIP